MDEALSPSEHLPMKTWGPAQDADPDRRDTGKPVKAAKPSCEGTRLGLRLWLKYGPSIAWVVGGFVGIQEGLGLIPSTT